MSNMPSLVSGPVRYALIAAIIPFLANFTLINNGVYRDYVATAGSGPAILLALPAFASLGAAEDKTRLGLTLLALAIGAFQLARGFGLVAFSLS